MKSDNKNLRNLCQGSVIIKKIQVYFLKILITILLVASILILAVLIIESTNFHFGEYAGISGSDWFKFFGGVGILGVSAYTLVDNINKHRETSKMQSLNQDIENWIKFVELAGIKGKTVASDLLGIYEERKGEERSEAEEAIINKIHNVSIEIVESEDSQLSKNDEDNIDNNAKLLLDEEE